MFIAGGLREPPKKRENEREPQCIAAMQQCKGPYTRRAAVSPLLGINGRVGSTGSAKGERGG